MTTAEINSIMVNKQVCSTIFTLYTYIQAHILKSVHTVHKQQYLEVQQAGNEVDV